MIGVVLVSHSSLSTAFKNAVEHVVGTQSQFEGICIEADDDMEQRRNDIVEAVARVDSGDGVVIVTDMFGGTPSNLAISLMQPGKVEILAGMNLPMLIKLAKARETQNIEKVLILSAEAGRKYINIASQVLAAEPWSAVPETLFKDLLIQNKKGLHARASARFVQTVETFDVAMTVSKDGINVGGTSIMGLMMLAASQGCTIGVSAKGADAQAAMDAIETLINDKFGEGE